MKSFKNRLQISKFKLDSLLDITLSINANLSTAQLLEKYRSILCDDLGIGKVMIFKNSGSWECILNAGFPKELEHIDVEDKLLTIKDIMYVSSEIDSKGVDIICPVYNNNSPLAFILIGDLEEEGEGMSPVLKHIYFIQTLSSIITVAIENMRLQKENLRQEIMKKELELASEMQMMLIPDNEKMPKTGYLSVCGYYHPHFEVGGDYYDCLPLSETKTGLCIADVSGKGIPAAILMSNFQATFRAIFSSDIRFDMLIRKLNAIVLRNSSGEKFITCFIARYDRDTRELEYVNAAHTPPVLYGMQTKSIRHLAPSCVGIGMPDFIPSIKTGKIMLEEPSKMICYTDGLSELKDKDGKEIGTKEIIKYISNNDPVEENVRNMIESLGIPDSNPSIFDDISIIAADLK